MPPPAAADRTSVSIYKEDGRLRSAARKIYDACDKGPRTQEDLAELTGLNVRTVAGVTPDLVAEALLVKVLEFLNSIEGAGYGGMASFEGPRGNIRAFLKARKQ